MTELNPIGQAPALAAEVFCCKNRSAAKGLRSPPIKIVTLAYLLFFLSATEVFAQGSFFEGKTIRIVVGLPAGDAYDLYARTLATYMGKYIPGNPNIMVQNMPGASSMITANYVYNFLFCVHCIAIVESLRGTRKVSSGYAECIDPEENSPRRR